MALRRSRVRLSLSPPDKKRIRTNKIKGLVRFVFSASITKKDNAKQRGNTHGCTHRMSAFSAANAARNARPKKSCQTPYSFAPWDSLCTSRQSKCRIDHRKKYAVCFGLPIFGIMSPAIWQPPKSKFAETVGKFSVNKDKRRCAPLGVSSACVHTGHPTASAMQRKTRPFPL